MPWFVLLMLTLPHFVLVFCAATSTAMFWWEQFSMGDGVMCVICLCTYCNPQSLHFSGQLINTHDGWFEEAPHQLMMVQTYTCRLCCWLCQIFSSCLDCAVGLCMHAATCTAVLALLQQACACNHAWWLPSPRPSFAFSQLTDVTQSIFLHFCNAKQYLFTFFFGLQFWEKQQHCTYRSRAR